MKRGVVTVLSVDGGGIRGLIPALMVRDLMRRVSIIDRYARCRRIGTITVGTLFDLFAGTSTGALLVLGLARKRAYTPHELVEIYRNHARTIFPPKRFASIRAVRQAFAEKYDVEPFERLLGTLFGDERLSDCRSNVLVASYDTNHRGPFFFKHYTDWVLRRNAALRKKEDPPLDFYLRDVARGTTAAPTYFTPAHISSIGSEVRSYSLLDGGLVANNPALSAYVEARKIYPNARKFIIVSLGTGRNGRRFTHEEIARWGYLDWVSPIHGVPMLAFLSDGQSKTVAHSLKNIPRVEYFRFNADLTTVAEEMDDARPPNMEEVETMARGIIRERTADLHRLAKLLHRSMMRRRRSGIAETG